MSCSDHVHLILRLHAPPRNLGMSCTDHVHLILRLHAPPRNLGMSCSDHACAPHTQTACTSLEPVQCKHIYICTCASV